MAFRSSFSRGLDFSDHSEPHLSPRFGSRAATGVTRADPNAAYVYRPQSLRSTAPPEPLTAAAGGRTNHAGTVQRAAPASAAAPLQHTHSAFDAPPLGATTTSSSSRQPSERTFLERAPHPYLASSRTGAGAGVDGRDSAPSPQPPPQLASPTAAGGGGLPPPLNSTSVRLSPRESSAYLQQQQLPLQPSPGRSGGSGIPLLVAPPHRRHLHVALADVPAQPPALAAGGSSHRSHAAAATTATTTIAARADSSVVGGVARSRAHSTSSSSCGGGSRAAAGARTTAVAAAAGTVTSAGGGALRYRVGGPTTLLPPHPPLPASARTTTAALPPVELAVPPRIPLLPGSRDGSSSSSSSSSAVVRGSRDSAQPSGGGASRYASELLPQLHSHASQKVPLAAEPAEELAAEHARRRRLLGHEHALPQLAEPAGRLAAVAGTDGGGGSSGGVSSSSGRGDGCSSGGSGGGGGGGSLVVALSRSSSSGSLAPIRPPGPPAPPQPGSARGSGSGGGGTNPLDVAARPAQGTLLEARLRALLLPTDAAAAPHDAGGAAPTRSPPSLHHLLPLQLRDVAPSAPCTAPSSARSSGEDPRPPPPPPPGALGACGGLAGLANLGNTCFMNSTLQCLFNTPWLRDYFLGEAWRRELNVGGSPTRGELAVAFARLLQQAWETPGPGGGGVLAPTALKAAVGQLASRRFAGYQQHDGHEFLRFLVEALCDDTSRLVGKCKPYRELDAPPDRADGAVADDWWRYYVARSQSTVWEGFTGQVRTRVTCDACGTVHRAFDPVQDLQLDIPPPGTGTGTGGGGGAGVSAAAGPVPLAACLAAVFAAEERLVGSEQYFCSRCRAHTDCVKASALYRLPPVMVLQLKRFVTSGGRAGGGWAAAGARAAKLDTPIAVPVAGLDVAPFCAPSAPALGGGGGGGGGGTLYDLLAVSCHSGSLWGGHYYAHARHPESGRWHTFNDSGVTGFDPASLEGGSNAAYVLFYGRRRGE